MEADYENRLDENLEPVRQLSKGQRRVLGVLVEKALTTPDQYPLTLKAATTGANQKSNRDPVTNYTENAIWDLLDQLRELGLVAVVHTESGRTERFRHYVRKRYPFNEVQLAVMTELMLRGRQQLGELRARASRMVNIESLDELRRELTSLMEQGYVQSSGPLERRGIEVDHNLYTDGEQQTTRLSSTPVKASSSEAVDFVESETAELTVSPSQVSAIASDEVKELRQTVGLLSAEVETLKSTLEQVRDDLSQLRQSLGA